MSTNLKQRLIAIEASIQASNDSKKTIEKVNEEIERSKRLMAEAQIYTELLRSLTNRN